MKHFLFIGCFMLLLAANVIPADTASRFTSDFPDDTERVWAGPEYWANPMEDWRITQGRLECISGGGNRNVHILTRELSDGPGDFRIGVRLGLLDSGKNPGSVGFRVGIQDQIDDYRARCFRGTGIEAGITTDGKLFIQNQSQNIKNQPSLKDVQLELTGKQSGSSYRLTLTATDRTTGKRIDSIVNDRIKPERLVGNISIVNNHAPKLKQGPRFWFTDWTIEGGKIVAHEDHAFGPILWSMHTFSRGVMKMTAQMPPVGKNDSQTVTLQIKRNEKWFAIGKAAIDPDARTATFRIENWDDTKDTPYRLVYSLKDGSGKIRDYDWTGTVRKDPLDRDELVVAGFTGQTDYGFPHLTMLRNLSIQNPDMLFFSGDQIYESVGGYGIIRTPADRSILNYLRKFYMFGWAFGDLMRDRITICLPDDHDVYQGNIWGNGGNPVPMKDHDAGGYAQPAQMVNAVHRTQTSHHPDVYDPTPIQQDISVFYGDMIYGGISFAMIADRMFKSGPKGTVATWPGRPDHVKDPAIDIASLDKSGLTLLGERQLKFLHEWAADWKGAIMKCVLSQTIFCNLATHHGGNLSMRLYADLDSNGWPQSGRNQAVDAIRRGFALHLAGDQHLPSLVCYGVDEFQDACWSFCVPAVSVGYPRSWWPDKLRIPPVNRPAHNLPNTGDYNDCLGNFVSVYAIGNPKEKLRRDSRVNMLHDKSSGYGIVRFDKPSREITMEAWRLIVDAAIATASGQFPGWPKTISMMDNYGRKAAAWLPEIKVSGMTDPVVQVIDETNGEIVYTLRIKGTVFRPKVFKKGTYTIQIGEQSTDMMKTYRGVKSLSANDKKVLNVKFN